MKFFESLDVGRMSISNRVMVPAMVIRLSAEDGHVKHPRGSLHVGRLVPGALRHLPGGRRRPRAGGRRSQDDV